MPYLILGIGVLLGLYSLYRFFRTASIPQIKAAFGVTALVVFAIALLFLSLTGRLPAAIALVVAILPFITEWMRRKNKGTPNAPDLTESEARDILNVTEEASEDDIRKAYKALMKKVHPDQQGSDYFAKKLNAAKDLLLKKR